MVGYGTGKCIVRSFASSLSLLVGLGTKLAFRQQELDIGIHQRIVIGDCSHVIYRRSSLGK